MPVDSKHPDYDERAPDWIKMAHVKRGQKAVKAEGQTYLPMPEGFLAADKVDVEIGDGEGGTTTVSVPLPIQSSNRLYQQYVTRAMFPDIFTPTLAGMLGLVHRKESLIQLPPVLEYLYERCTKTGKDIESFHSMLTEEVLTNGRVAILVDVAPPPADGVAPPADAGLPFLAAYTATTLINWEEDRTFFMLDESGRKREGYEWKDFKRYRELKLEGGVYRQIVHQVTDADDDLQAGEEFIPTARGSSAGLTAIPLVVIGALNHDVAPGMIPLEGVAEYSLAIYRLDADYRHQLFYSGQETLVVVGGGQDSMPTHIGAGAVISLPGGGPQVPAADAKYIGPKGSGIEAHRKAIQDDREAAVASGARVFDSKKGAESGEALRLRFGAQTANLVSMAISVALGLQQALRNAGIFMGLGKAELDKIIVTPNLEFLSNRLTPDQALELVKMWQSGGISRQTLWENLQRGEIASADRTWEDEEEAITLQDPLVSATGMKTLVEPLTEAQRLPKGA